MSLFKRLKVWFEREQQSQEILFPITMLDTQYRMHNEICHFPSTTFYQGVIKTASSVKARNPLPFQPYIILEHESLEDNSGYIIYTCYASCILYMFLISSILNLYVKLF